MTTNTGTAIVIEIDGCIEDGDADGGINGEGCCGGIGGGDGAVKRSHRPSTYVSTLDAATVRIRPRFVDRSMMKLGAKIVAIVSVT